MDKKLSRRDFLGTMGSAAAASVALVSGAKSAPMTQSPQAAVKALNKTTPYKKVVLEPFDYAGVTLRPSLWQRQASSGRDFYLGLSNDDILHGYRKAAGTANPPGRVLGGWASPNSDVVFGQWLQSMARMQRAYGDKDLLEKAGILVSEYAKCRPGMSGGGGRGVGPTAGLNHYPYEKLVGGLLDMHHYGGHPEAMALCDKITEAAVPALNRDRVPANREPWELHSGRPLEWYTMPENLYRAYQVTGNAMYKEFADAWLYPAYSGQVRGNQRPQGRPGRARVQPLQQLLERRPGLRRDGRRKIPALDEEFLRLGAEAPDLCHGRLRPGRALRVLRRSPGRFAGDLLRQLRVSLLRVGGDQAREVPHDVHRRGALRRLDRTAAVQRHRRGAVDQGPRHAHVLHGSPPRFGLEIFLAQRVHLLLGHLFPEHHRVFEFHLF